jgi:SNF2 family DNA or RNA helicase
MIWSPFKYQLFALKHAIEHPFSGLLLDMGLGKTCIALTLVNYCINYDFCIRKPLIIAPKKVLENTWDAEIEKWDHLKHLKLVKIHGNLAQKMEALKQKGDIYIVSRDNIAWLQRHYMSSWPFDMVVVDESSSFKNPSSQRFRALKMCRPFFKRSIIMTGTPIPNGLNDLWSQIYILDQGKRLGEFIEHYRREYLYPEPTASFETRKYTCTESNQQRIFSKIGDIAISMKSEHYLELPPLIETIHKVSLPDDIKKRYKEFEKTQVLKAYDEAGKDIAALNAGALLTKLRQFANGAIYENDSRNWVVEHDEKLEACDELIESIQTQGEPVLISYQFQHDLERLKKKFGGRELQPGDVDKWNAGQLKIMYLQYDAGMGLNLQFGGCHAIHYGMNYNLESYLQFNKRLHRTGQKKPVYIHKMLAVGTVDMDVNRAVEGKRNGQDAMLEAVRALVDEHINNK